MVRAAGSGGAAAAGLDGGDEALDVFRGDAIGDDGWGLFGREVEVQAVFFAGTDKIGDEVHAAAGLDPARLAGDIGGFDEDVAFQEDQTIEREIAKRCEVVGGLTN